VTAAKAAPESARRQGRIGHWKHVIIRSVALLPSVDAGRPSHGWSARIVPVWGCGKVDAGLQWLKTIHLVELLNDELGTCPLYLENQFKGMARDVARLFSHSGPDPLLAELFAKRSLPTDEYELAVAAFLDAYVAREKAARAL
jgi:hypothetical protein